MDAEMDKGILVAAGFAAMVRADDCGGMRPHLQLQGVELLVRAEDAVEALGLLEAQAADEEIVDEN